jgi:hypothetical protein
MTPSSRCLCGVVPSDPVWDTIGGAWCRQHAARALGELTGLCCLPTEVRLWVASVLSDNGAAFVGEGLAVLPFEETQPNAATLDRLTDE